jgi:hypothetical protein
VLVVGLYTDGSFLLVTCSEWGGVSRRVRFFFLKNLTIARIIHLGHFDMCLPFLELNIGIKHVTAQLLRTVGLLHGFQHLFYHELN